VLLRGVLRESHGDSYFGLFNNVGSVAWHCFQCINMNQGANPRYVLAIYTSPRHILVAWYFLVLKCGVMRTVSVVFVGWFVLSNVVRYCCSFFCAVLWYFCHSLHVVFNTLAIQNAMGTSMNHPIFCRETYLIFLAVSTFTVGVELWLVLMIWKCPCPILKSRSVRMTIFELQA
jgi:hypothetical protein